MKKYTKQQLKRLEEMEKRIEQMERMEKDWNSMVSNFHVENPTEIPVYENNKWR